MNIENRPIPPAALRMSIAVESRNNSKPQVRIEADQQSIAEYQA